MTHPEATAEVADFAFVRCAACACCGLQSIGMIWHQSEAVMTTTGVAIHEAAAALDQAAKAPTAQC